MFLFNGIVMVLALLILLFVVKPYYTSTITILPEFGRKTTFSNLSDLAAMAGISVGESAGTDIYQDLIYSESVLQKVIYTKYTTEEFDKAVNLIEFFDYEVDEDDPEDIGERRVFLEVFKNLTKKRITSSLDRKTRILTVNVTMPESKLSSEVANNILTQLDDYLRTKTKTYAKEQRFYIEKRVKEVRDSLTIAENSLKIISRE